MNSSRGCDVPILYSLRRFLTLTSSASCATPLQYSSAMTLSYDFSRTRPNFNGKRAKRLKTTVMWEQVQSLQGLYTKTTLLASIIHTCRAQLPPLAHLVVRDDMNLSCYLSPSANTEQKVQNSVNTTQSPHSVLTDLRKSNSKDYNI